MTHEQFASSLRLLGFKSDNILRIFKYKGIRVFIGHDVIRAMTKTKSIHYNRNEKNFDFLYKGIIRLIK